MLREETEQRVQELLRKLMVVLCDLNDIEKTVSHLRDETNKLASKLNGTLND